MEQAKETGEVVAPKRSELEAELAIFEKAGIFYPAEILRVEELKKFLGIKTGDQT